MSVALPERSATWRAWLLADEPASSLQARLGRGYLSWLGFSRNPLAVTGLGIVLALVLVAALAPWVATHSPIGQNLADRLQPLAQRCAPLVRQAHAVAGRRALTAEEGSPVILEVSE